jgi:3-methyl-2-oxobutanoate hydroxymethyltransferase
MKSIYTFGGQFGERNWTVYDLLNHKGKSKLTQVTADSHDEAVAAEAAGIDMLSVDDCDVEIVRAGAPHTFITGVTLLTDHVTNDEILRAAFKCMEQGADAVYTCASLNVVEMLANRDLPVMGHLGLVPRLSTYIGGLRAFGKTAEEGIELFRQIRRLEDAGAFAVELEVSAEEVVAEISKRTKLLTTSIGAGSGADVMFLFTKDLCGQNEKAPRHAKEYGNLRRLEQQIKDERLACLREFNKEAKDGRFPSAEYSVKMPAKEFEKFMEQMASQTTEKP